MGFWEGFRRGKQEGLTGVLAEEERKTEVEKKEKRLTIAEVDLLREQRLREEFEEKRSATAVAGRAKFEKERQEREKKRKVSTSKRVSPRVKRLRGRRLTVSRRLST